MTLCYDVLNPTRAHEAETHKLKRLIQSPDSYFMDVKCKLVLCQPTGGHARLSEGVSFRKKPQ